MFDDRPEGDEPAVADSPGGEPGDAHGTVPRPLSSLPWRARLAELRNQLPASPARWAASMTALVVLVVAAWWFLRPPPPAVEKSLPMASRSDAGTASGSGAGPGRSLAAASTAPVSTVMTVHAAGAVVRPGVYRLVSGARVTDLLTSAGGLATDADGDRINLAAPVQDGERVYVPHRGEEAVPAAVGDLGSPSSGAASAGTGGAGGKTSAPGDPSTGSGPVDLNTATAEQLDALPGVGPSTAQAILDYRQQHGRFQSVDELLDVRGIGDAKLAQLRDRVRVR